MPDAPERKVGETQMLSSRASSIACGVLLAVFFLQSFSASLRKSPAYDEVIHIAAGLSYVSTGQIVINQQHPPLLKELAGLFLRTADVRWPSDAQARALAEGTLSLNGPLPKPLMADVSIGYVVAKKLMADNGVDRVLFWARLPLILLATGFGYVLFLFARSLAGTAAAVGALFLYAFDPVILAHSSLVTTDVGSAGFILLTLLALWTYLQSPSPRLVIACGCALGAALCAKFSTVVLLPVAGLLLLCAAVWPPLATSRTKKASSAVPAAQSAPAGGRKRNKSKRKLERPTDMAPPGFKVLLWRYARASAGMGLVAAVVIEVIYLFPSDPFQYIAGMRLVNADHMPGFQYYMAGQLARRFYSYYVFAYLLKEPLAAIVLAGLGLIFVLRQPRFSLLARALMLLTPAVLMAGYTIFSDNIGVRYIAPVLLFAHLLGGIALATLVESGSAWKRAGAAVLCAWLVVAAAGIYPDHLSYFNETACLLDTPSKTGLDGGTRCGPTWLDDSNVDWGQGLKQLKAWLDRNAPDKTIRLAYLGMFPPEGYGIHYEPISDADLASPRPGLYAVSASVMARLRAKSREPRAHDPVWLRQVQPAAIVGHAYYIFDAPARGRPAEAVHR